VGKHLALKVFNLKKRTLREYVRLLNDSYQNRTVLERHLRSLEVLKYVVENLYGAEAVVVIWPFFRNFYQENYRLMKKEFEKFGVDIIDLVTLFDSYETDKLVVNKRDLHPNEYANKMVAVRIDQFLKRRLKKEQ
jgi:hypothetical protein